MAKTSYLGVVGLGKVTPIRFGEVVDSIFIEITNSDARDGFVIEYEGIVKIYEEIMKRNEGFTCTIETRNQTLDMYVNQGFTDLTISSKDSWKSENCADIKELEEGLNVHIPNQSRMLIPTQLFIKKLFRIMTAKERNLFRFR